MNRPWIEFEVPRDSPIFGLHEGDVANFQTRPDRPMAFQLSRFYVRSARFFVEAFFFNPADYEWMRSNQA